MVRLEGLWSFEEEMVGGLNLDGVQGLGRERKRARLQEQRERGRTEGIRSLADGGCACSTEGCVGEKAREGPCRCREASLSKGQRLLSTSSGLLGPD